MTEDERTELAVFLMKASGLRESQRRRDTLGALEILNAPGVLSAQAMASVLGITEWRVRVELGSATPKVRGKLNPAHLSILAYALSNEFINDTMLGLLLEDGTSLITIARLTGIPERTLRRQKRTATL